MLQEGKLGFDRVFDALHLVAYAVAAFGQRVHHPLTQWRNRDVAIRPSPVREAIEDELVLEAELPSLVRDTEDDDH